MSEEISTEVIKKTQESLGKFIKKPVLTEKLLKKPPFRFLHDITTAVIKETGFLNGLFTNEEMLSENVKTKEAKLEFLKKLIETMKIINVLEITAKPSKIIAGHEPEKTNKLLQAIGKALQKKISSSEAVTQIKTGVVKEKKSKTIIDESKTKNEKVDTDKNEKITTKNIAIKKVSNKSKNDKPTNLESKNKNSQQIDKRDRSRSRQINSETNLKEQKKNDNARPNKIKKKPSLIEMAVNDSTNIIDEKKTIVKQTTLSNDSELTTTDSITPADSQLKNILNKTDSLEKVIEDLPLENNNEVHVEPIPEKEINHVAKEDVDKETPKQVENISEEKIEDFHNEIEDTLKNDISKNNTKIDTPETKPKSIIKDSSMKPYINNIERGQFPLRTGSARPGSSRPSSARPAAPRIRDRNDPTQHLIQATKVNVIVENHNTDIDEEENLVVVETAPTEVPLPVVADQTDILITQGHLVEQILETQKRFDEDIVQKPQIHIEWEADGQRNREAKQRDINHLRKKIQTVTCAALPLGQIISFLQEDYDNIVRELRSWESMNAKLDEEISKHKSIAEESLEPYKKQLADIENDIAKQKEQNVNIKSEIFRNQQKVNKLISSLY